MIILPHLHNIYEAKLDVRHKEQKDAYNKILAGCEILKSIKPMADKILSGYQNKE